MQRHRNGGQDSQPTGDRQQRHIDLSLLNAVICAKGKSSQRCIELKKYDRGPYRNQRLSPRTIGCRAQTTPDNRQEIQTSWSTQGPQYTSYADIAGVRHCRVEAVACHLGIWQWFLSFPSILPARYCMSSDQIGHWEHL
jgi:hypothetical protein